MINLIFDTETTGLPVNWGAHHHEVENWPRLVSLSYILKDSEKATNEEFDYIIKPEGFIIPEEVTKIHGITTEMALDKGIDVKEAISQFIEILAKADVVVAHNMSFDKAIVAAECYRQGRGEEFKELFNQKQSFCTMLKSTSILKLRGTHAGGNKWPKLIELYRFLFNEDFSGAHNSLADSRACARCYEELTRKI